LRPCCVSGASPWRHLLTLKASKRGPPLTSLQVAELIGAQRPAWSHLPSEVRSSAGAEAIDLARAAGLVLDDWQSWVLDKSLGENDAGSWSAFEVALLVGRQNGKNAILEARELAGIVLFGDDLIVHTAHRADTTMEHFRRMEQYADEFDEFRRLVKRVSRKNGDESIELKGGRRIKFVCRARNPGRGFSGSCIVFDEALASLDGGVIGAMIPTLATRSMAQVWYTSSAPRADSDFLHDVCRRGRAW
jgi:phage terminase large subunit-like protein